MAASLIHKKSVSTTAEEVTEEPMVEKVVKEATKRRQAPPAELVSKKKRTTVRIDAPKEKDLSIVHVESDEEETEEKDTDEKETDEKKTDAEEKDKEPTDSEDTEPLIKVHRLTEISVSDEESMYIDDILKQITDDMILPSTAAKEPTLIKFGRGIAFREVDWYKATLPKIDPTDKGKEPLVEEIKGNPAKESFALVYADVNFLVQIRDAVIEEIVSFFNSFSIRGLAALNSVSDLAAKSSS
ncbi:hypothetical protein F511_16946 [Dorcoceras hygrometricum]|uniref:Uncharacterized protein n=1 Tax=Dorcoceras hygrometricum TaxID=472368 RepID=A0A2Z7D777_9LAMI|nr:hypothetical protein F511_16946 [Dorcoceras hygrometricum]